MAIILTLRKQEFQLDGVSIQVKAALQKLNLSPEAHLLVRDGELLNENDYLKDGDKIKIVAVISGGSTAFDLPLLQHDRATYLETVGCGPCGRPPRLQAITAGGHPNLRFASCGRTLQEDASCQA